MLVKILTSAINSAIRTIFYRIPTAILIILLIILITFTVGIVKANAFYLSTASEAFNTSNLTSHNGYSNYVTSSSSITQRYVKTTTAGTGLKYYKYGNLPGTYTSLGITTLYIDWSLQINSGQCGLNFGWRKDSTAIQNFNVVSNKSTSISATTTSLVISFWGMDDGNIFAFGVAPSTGSVTSDCLLTVTRIYDEDGNDYLLFYDQDSFNSSPSNSSTTVNVNSIDYTGYLQLLLYYFAAITFVVVSYASYKATKQVL